MAEPLTVLYEDNHCLAVAKPASLSTQGPPHSPEPTLESLARDYLRVRYHKPGNVYLGIPHRLDRPVSGVVLFARNTKAARRIALQFAERQVRKVYWALVEGEVQPESGTWEDYLRKAPDQARVDVVEPGDPGAKLARLRYRRLGAASGETLLELDLETGRTHQIRVQAAKRGWPVRGDVLYGARQLFGPSGREPGSVIALHARRLTFLHPIRYEPLTVEAPLPSTWIGISGSTG